ncbi:MAG: DDE-type integrase/transposase/recombinase [Janthinobacterium lividum]
MNTDRVNLIKLVRETAPPALMQQSQDIIEADYGVLKQLIRPARGLQTMKTVYATIKGFEIMRMIRREHCILREPSAAGEVRFVNKLFGLRCKAPPITRPKRVHPRKMQQSRKLLLFIFGKQLGVRAGGMTLQPGEKTCQRATP